MKKIENFDSILYVTIDALRYDIVYSDEIETPNMRKLVNQGLDFERAFSNGCATAEAFPALLYSQMSSKEGNAPKTKSIASVLQEEFETVGITCNPNTSRYYDYGKGFDEFVDFTKPTKQKEDDSSIFKIGKKIAKRFDFIYDLAVRFRATSNLPYERAGKMNQEVLDKLSDEKQFIWAHYMDPHAPYSPPEKYGKQMCPQAYSERGKIQQKFNNDNIDPETGGKMWELYKAESKYLDDQLGNLLEKLEERDEEFLIIFTADHGEAFGEKGVYKHGNYFKDNIHVPLSFYTTSDKIGETSKELASHLDIGPSLCSLSGLDIPGSFEGIDIFNEKRETAIIQKEDVFVAINDKWKVIEDSGENYLYNISDGLDEEENLYEEKPEIVEKLKTHKKEDELEGIDF